MCVQMREITWDTACPVDGCVFLLVWRKSVGCSSKASERKVRVSRRQWLKYLLAPPSLNTGIARPFMVTSAEMAADYYEAVHTQVVWCWMEPLTFVPPLLLPG